MSHLLRKLSIRQRLWLIVALILLASVTMTAVPITYTADLFVDSQKNLTQVQVETAKKIVEHFYSMEQDGALPRTEAKRLALETLEAASLNDRNYFYVYHRTNFIVMHPFLKLQSYSDEPASVIPESRQQFLASIDAIVEQLGLSGEGRASVDFIERYHPDTLTGFFDYLLYVDPSGNGILGPIDDTNMPASAEQKMGYGSHFEPWQWVIFGGVFLEDSDEVYEALLTRMLLPGLLVFSALVLFTYVISRSITEPLSDTVNQIEQINLAESWSTHLSETDTDEVGALSRSFNKMFDRIEEHIKEERFLEDRLRHSQKMEAVGQLTGGIAHDFNNLLTVVQGNIELAKDQSDSEIRATLLESANQASERGALLVERLLAYSRKQSLTPKTTNLNELLEGTKFLLERSIGENINIEITEHPELWACEIDRAQMENCMMNLAINARDAMPTGGNLTISTNNITVVEETPRLAAGDYATIEIKDSGSGITPELLDRVFEPFFTTKLPGQGSGLGLSMVYGFVAQSQGDMKIASEPGRGTSITLYLPRAYADPSSADATGAEELIRGAGQKLLVVEDEEDLRRTTERMLNGMGYQTLAAASTDEALEVLKKTTDVDLLITDMVLSENRTGVAMAALAQSERYGLPVLFVSGYSEHPALRQGDIRQGVNFLKKPFTKIALSHMVAKVLNDHQGEIQPPGDSVA
jgi:signal transduction histidine kinase/ActR/RegA family two-component response regulator